MDMKRFFLYAIAIAALALAGCGGGGGGMPPGPRVDNGDTGRRRPATADDDASYVTKRLTYPADCTDPPPPACHGAGLRHSDRE